MPIVPPLPKSVDDARRGLEPVDDEGCIRNLAGGYRGRVMPNQPPGSETPGAEPFRPGSPGPESLDGASGMGSTPSGPSFAPGSPQPRWSRPLGPEPVARPDPETYQPPRSRLPAVLTALAVGVVALVVALASVLAHRADQVVAIPSPTRSAASPHITVTKDSIEFTTRSGAGRLTILDHTWRDAQNGGGSALQVRIRIACSSGVVDYDPFDFQAFDASGSLFDLATEEVDGPLLGVGALQAGEQTTGLVAFVIPRGEVTLLMSDDADSVTALKVPD